MATSPQRAQGEIDASLKRIQIFVKPVPSTDCNRRVLLLPLYESLVRSILDYGAPVYELTPKSQLSILDPIQNAALRNSTGAFRTSPAPTLYADAGILPLNYRRLTLASNLLCSVLQLPDSSVHQAIFETPLLPCYVQRRTDQKVRVQLALQKNRLPLPAPR